jgi:imidazolonepropionase
VTQEFFADEIVSPEPKGLRRVQGACIVFDEKILRIEKVSLQKLKLQPRSKRVAAIIPGLVDPHTHLVFAGNRSGEWESRLRGASYQEIAKKGGGIALTVKKTQGLSFESLLQRSKFFLQHWINQGCTTLEIKSGYGLELETELKILRVIATLKKSSRQCIFASFMGAHKIPNHHSEASYVDELIETHLPAVRGLADFQDVFVEKNYFGPQQSIRLLRAGQKLGLKARVHAHEFGRTGGVRAACAVNALSADHLQHVSEADLRALKKAGVVPVVLTGTSFFLGAKKFAPARKMLDAGLPVALASDFNPGTNPGLNLSLVGTMAAIHQGLHLDEVLRAQTWNAALSLGLRDRGLLRPGFRADLAVLGCSRFEDLYYHYGSSWVEKVFASGKEIKTSVRL